MLNDVVIIVAVVICVSFVSSVVFIMPMIVMIRMTCVCRCGSHRRFWSVCSDD